MHADESGKFVYVQMVSDSITELKLEIRDTMSTSASYDDILRILGQGSDVGFSKVGSSVNGLNTWKISFDNINAAIRKYGENDQAFDINQYEQISNVSRGSYNTKIHGSMDFIDAIRGAAAPFDVELKSGEFHITFGDESTSSNDLTKLYVNGTAIDMNSADNVFHASKIVGAELKDEETFTYIAPTIESTVSGTTVSIVVKNYYHGDPGSNLDILQIGGIAGADMKLFPAPGLTFSESGGVWTATADLANFNAEPSATGLKFVLNQNDANPSDDPSFELKDLNLLSSQMSLTVTFDDSGDTVTVTGIDTDLTGGLVITLVDPQSGQRRQKNL